jgi:hypothetical protein
MKTNKFFAVALAALTLVGFNACKPGGGNEPKPTPEGDLALDKTALNLEVNAEETITATIAVSFESSNPQVASVTPANDGKSAKVKALAEGSAVITAKSQGGQVKTCIVAVKAKGGQGGKELKGSQVWPIALDGTTADANKSKIVADFRPNDVDQFLYVWENGTVYEAGEGKGLNFYGNTDGYTALKVTNLGWAGAGFCLTDAGNGWQAAKELKEAIVANPDQYFLHMAMKSTDNYSHCFYIFGAETTKFCIGSKGVYDGPVYSDFARDGAWHEFDIPMSAYASALANQAVAAGVNVFVVLSEGVQGAELNLDAVYFYKK